MLLGLVVSGLTALRFARKADGADLARFEALCERLQGELVRRVEMHENGLKGARGVFAASTSVERAEFRELVATHDIGREFPGCLGMGYIHRVRRSELAAYLERVRADGAPAFEIRNDAGGDELFVVQYIEPVPEGVEVLGLDIGFEQGRRAAAEAAMRTGEAVLTPPIGLLRGDRQGPGLLYLLPFYRRGASVETEAQRVEALEGWVYMPLLASGVFAGVSGVTDGALDFEVFDGAEPALSAMLYDDDGHLRDASGTWEGATARERYAGRHLQRYGTVNVGGRTWTVSMSTTPAFEPSSRLTVWLTGIGGALLSVLLGAFLHAQNAALGRATMLAESMTRDMRRLALVAERTTSIVIITNAQRRIEWVNEAFTRLSGYTLDEVRGKVPGHILQFEGTDPATVEAIRAALAAGEGFRGEIKNRGKHGREYWLDVDIQPLRERDGAITGYMAVESDITPLIERGEALQRANAALEEAQSVARMGNWSYDVRTGRVEWSHELYAMFGRDESLGPPDYPTAIAYYDKESAARLDEAVRRAVDHGEEYRLDLRTREGVGGVRWVRAHGRVRRDDAGRVTGLFGTAADVTAMVEREEALRESQSLLSTVLDILPQRVFWKDRQGRYLGANRAFLADAGVDDVIGKSDADLGMDPAKAAFALECDLCVMDLNEPDLDIEEPQKRADGSTAWVSTSRVPLRNAQGEVVGLLGTYVDITPQREARDSQRRAIEMAEAASRSKSEFLANMSHEIRTPMTAILGYADLLDADDGRELDAGQRAEYVDTIRRNGQHLLAIINDILDLSKIESGKMTIERIETDPLGVIRDVVGLMEVKARAKGLTLRLEQAGSIPEQVVSDPVRLRQILVNLIGNAIKFTEVGGVLVRVSLESSYSPILRISVNDTGIGIRQEHRERLFGAFSQADASTTRRFGGTGLGLQISRRLARIMGGDIQVESVPGEGSTFTLTLATELPPGVRMIGPGDGAAPPEVPERRADATPGARPLEGVRLLLAEDGPDNQRLIAFHLKRAGAEVSVVETGLAAVRSLCRGEDEGGSLIDPAPVDAVLMDMQMPEMDGYAATRALRSKGCEIPIIALTAHAMAGDRERCLEAGCSGYTTKPINAAEMVALIAEQVGRVRKGVARSGGTSHVEPPRESAMPSAMPKAA